MTIDPRDAPGSRPLRRRSPAATLALVLAVLVVGLAAWLRLPAYPDFDDPYIALHSAQSLVAGHDAAYGVPPLTGVTSPAHVLLLAGLLAAGVPVFDAVRLASTLGVLAFVCAVWRLGAATGLAPVSRALLTGVVLASGLTWVQLASGLETGLAMAAVTAGIAWLIERRYARVALLTGFLPWLRPDTLPAAAVLLGWSLWQSSAADRRRLVGLAALVTAPWAVWTFSQTGAVWPSTIGAKAHFFAEGCAPLMARAGRLGGGVWSWWLAALPASAGLLALPLRPAGRLGLIAMVAALAAFLVVLPGAVWHNHHRYLYPIVLPWAVLGVAMAGRRAERFGPVVLAVALAGAVWHTPEYWTPNPMGAAELAATSEWIEEHTPPDATILVQDAGAAAVFTSRRLVDIVGLKSTLALETHARLTWPTCGLARPEAVEHIARASGAQYLVTNRDWEEHFAFTATLRARGFAVEPVRQPPRDWPGGYTVARLVPPAGDAR